MARLEEAKAKREREMARQRELEAQRRQDIMYILRVLYSVYSFLRCVVTFFAGNAKLRSRRYGDRHPPVPAVPLVPYVEPSHRCQLLFRYSFDCND